jgi:hypothetical protein
VNLVVYDRSGKKVFETWHQGNWIWSKPDKDCLEDAFDHLAYAVADISRTQAGGLSREQISSEETAEDTVAKKPRLTKAKASIEKKVELEPPKTKNEYDTPYLVGGSDVTAPILTIYPLPPYTDEAREAHVQGAIRIQCIFRKNGIIDNCIFLDSLGYGLDLSAYESIRNEWTFTPGNYKGKPVDVQATVKISYSIIE